MGSNRELEYSQTQVTASDFGFDVKRVSMGHRWDTFEPLDDVGYDRINVVRPEDSNEFLRKNTSIEEKLDEAGIEGDTFDERLEKLKAYKPTDSVGDLNIKKNQLQGELGEELAQTWAMDASVDMSETPDDLDRARADIDGLGMRDGSLVTVESKYSIRDTTFEEHLRENTGWEEVMGFDGEDVDRDAHWTDLRLDPEVQQVLQEEISDLGAASQHEESHIADVLAELGDEIPDEYIERYRTRKVTRMGTLTRDIESDAPIEVDGTDNAIDELALVDLDGCIPSLDREARQKRIESETKEQLVDEHGLDESIASDVAGSVAESSYDLSDNIEELADHIKNTSDIDRRGIESKINEIGQRKYDRLSDIRGVGETLESRIHDAGYDIDSTPTANELREDIHGLGPIMSEDISNCLKEINGKDSLTEINGVDPELADRLWQVGIDIDSIPTPEQAAKVEGVDPTLAHRISNTLKTRNAGNEIDTDLTRAEKVNAIKHGAEIRGRELGEEELTTTLDAVEESGVELNEEHFEELGRDIAHGDVDPSDREAVADHVKEMEYKEQAELDHARDTQLGL